jgi:ABC-type transporter Mla maintaining outer membrane lipid asymmetry ATPase subunit MlaF
MTEQQIEKNCKYLDDEPVALTDSLVTKAIVEEITNKDKHGKIIGILGGWGSGKSSIIEGV